MAWPPASEKGKKRARKGERSRAEVFGETTTDRSGLLSNAGKATLALTRLHKHVQYLTPAQFPPLYKHGWRVASIRSDS